MMEVRGWRGCIPVSQKTSDVGGKAVTKKETKSVSWTLRESQGRESAKTSSERVAAL